MKLAGEAFQQRLLDNYPMPFYAGRRRKHAMNPDFLREAIRLSLEKMEAGEGGPFGVVIPLA